MKAITVTSARELEVCGAPTPASALRNYLLVKIKAAPPIMATPP